MSYKKTIYSIVLIILLLSIFVVSCSQQSGQTYDPSKKYAAFLVVNVPNNQSALESARSKAIGDGYEIGPIEYYDPGTKDFEAIIKKLIPNQQITLIWISGSLLDSPNIQKALNAAGFKGGVRYMPVSTATPSYQ